MRMKIAVNGLAADEYESSVVVNIELNRNAESTMASKWTSHCPGRGAPHGSNRWQTDNRQFCPDRYGAAAAGPGLCGCGYVPGSRPACFGRQSRDVPSLRRGGSPGVGAQARDGDLTRAWGRRLPRDWLPGHAGTGRYQ